MNKYNNCNQITLKIFGRDKRFNYGLYLL